MARIAKERTEEIKEAAARLFLQKGYSKTQMSHIAKELGISAGTIYYSFNSKQEILYLILKEILEPDCIYRKPEEPLTDKEFHKLEDQIIEIFEQNGKKFSSHLENDSAGYSFEELISDAFDLLDKYAVGCLFIEKNQWDFPRMAESYKKYRKQFLDYMTKYLKLFVEKGQIRPIPHPEITTVLIMEILTWWAMDRKYTSFETNTISTDLAKEVCMDNIISAYMR